MENEFATLQKLVEALPPITLEEMSSIRLMKRTDTKFVTNIPTLQRLLEMAVGKYYSQEVAGHRISPYRTVYWDTEDRHDMFRMHLCGHSPRTKVRMRTYVDSGLTFLEVKRKDNHGKTSKKRIQVPSFEAVMKEHAGEEFLTERSGYTFEDITPTLGNRFNRITLVNYEKTERLTIDFGLAFHGFESGEDAEMPGIVIVELKRDGRVPSPILSILRELRVKPAGFSKYCIGLSLTNDHIPKNRFKPRLRKVGRIAVGRK